MQQIGQMQKTTGQLGNLLKTGLKVGALAGAAAIVSSVKAFGDFDAAMTKSLAIMGDVSEAQEKDMVNAARKMAKETTYSATDAANSYFYLASAGLDAKGSIAALPTVAKFAQAGMFDMALATDLLTDAQSALGLTIRDDAVKNMENMVRVSDVLVKANTLANATVQQFSESLTNRAGAALRMVNKDIEEGVAVLAAFADQGIKGAEAGTRLDIVLRDLQSKAVVNKETFKALGVSVFDTEGNMRNIADVIADLENLLGPMNDEVKRATLLQLGFSDRSVASILALMGMSDQIKVYEKELRSAGGITETVAKKQLQTFNAQLNLLMSELTDIAIELGSKIVPLLVRFMRLLRSDIIPAMKRVADALRPVTEFIARHPELLYAVIAAWAAWKIAHIAHAMWELKAAIVGVNLSLIGPVGLVAAVTIASYALKDYADKIPVISRLIEGSKQYQKDYNQALLEAEDLYRRNLISAEELRERGIEALFNALRDMVPQVSEYGASFIHLENVVGHGAGTYEDATERIAKAAAELVKDLQREGISYDRILKGLEEAGIEWKDTIIDDVLEPMRIKYYQTMVENDTALRLLEVAHKRAGKNVASDAAALAAGVDKSFEEIKDDIESVLPTMDEEFAAWRKRLENMASAYENFEDNLSAVYKALRKANVKNIDAIVQYIAKEGPEFTQFFKEYMADKPIDELRQAGRDMNKILSADLDSLTQSVLDERRAMADAAEQLRNVLINPFVNIWAGGQAIGESFVSGLIAGIQSMLGALIQAAADAVAAAEEAARQEAETGSPSRMMMRLGRDLIEGLRAGFEQPQLALATSAQSAIAVPTISRQVVHDMVLQPSPVRVIAQVPGGYGQQQITTHISGVAQQEIERVIERTMRRMAFGLKGAA